MDIWLMTGRGACHGPVECPAGSAADQHLTRTRPQIDYGLSNVRLLVAFRF
jgi:hypothetical protein